MKTLKDINWNQVYCFYEVARKLSMKEASKLLGVSTPTVSEQIKRLEAMLGVPLFRRYPRRIELTNEGATLFTCAKDMFEAGGRFLDTVSPNSIGGYSVRVGMQETMASSVGVDFVNQYWDLFAPYGTVSTAREVIFETLVEKLLGGAYDWAVSFEKPNSSRLAWQQVCRAELVFCCSANLFERFSAPPDILRAIPLARCAWDRILNEAIDDAFRRVEIYPEEHLESDHPDLVMNLARRGRCVAIFPRETVESSSWSRELRIFTLTEPVYLELYALWPKGSEKMISIRKLTELLEMPDPPHMMGDPDFQIKVGEARSELFD